MYRKAIQPVRHKLFGILKHKLMNLSTFHQQIFIITVYFLDYKNYLDFVNKQYIKQQLDPLYKLGGINILQDTYSKSEVI